MGTDLKRIVIIGATGPTGIHLARELVTRGHSIRVVSRNLENLGRAFGNVDVERMTADALDESSIRGAVAGCDLVIDCIGLPGNVMEQHAVTARVIVDAAASVGARCLQEWIAGSGEPS